MDDREKITYFAETDARNKRVKFGIKAEDRLRHIYSIGKTGMGKSTMLENMAIQDIQNGEGMAFLDPHGKTADLLLSYIPEHRIKDVVYFAPFDTDFPISFNVMEDVGPERRHLVLSGLMSAFEKLFGEESFSDRMQYILQNTILALLEYPDATMLGINRMLTDKVYRNKVVANVKDTSVKTYWVKEFASYTERFAAEATPAIQNKIGQFTSNPLIRNIIGQAKSSFNMREIMDQKKILIVNLSKGLVGENNANLLGSMLVTKMYLAAMSRADSSPQDLAKLPNFYLYVDEFQSFANKSFADILSEARKYKLSLNITHQYVEQMAEEVRAAVFGNVGTMITFRVGSFDAEILEKEFAPVFTMEDLVNLGQFQVYLKLMIDNVASQPFSATTLPAVPKPEVSYYKEVMEESRKNYTHPKAEVEKEIKEWHDIEVQALAKPVEPRREERQPAPSQSSAPKALYEPRKDVKPEVKVEIKPEMKTEPKKTEPNNSLAKALEKAMKEKVEIVTKHEIVREEKIEKTTIPLEALKKDDRNKNKDGTPENKNALAEALKKISNNPSPKETIIEKQNKSTATSEVPEEVLRKVLNG